jgi:flagellar protein FliS
MVAKNPYAQYKEQSLSTLAPGEELVKLFDELLKQNNVAVKAIEGKDYALANDSLTKAQTILGTLASSLDMRYPISANLRDLYIFLSQQLLKANMRKDVKIVNECIPLMRDLRDSFEQAEKISRKQHAGG